LVAGEKAGSKLAKAEKLGVTLLTEEDFEALKTAKKQKVESIGRQLQERLDDVVRVIRALEHPEVDILAHPTGRLLNRREAFEIEMEDVLAAAAENQVAVEINANPLRLDLNEFHARRAAELGVMVVVNTDAHSFSDLEYMSYGVAQAQRAWLQPSNVLNTRGIRDLKSWLKRKD
jgi:DNA polymerase (family 10)